MHQGTTVPSRRNKSERSEVNFVTKNCRSNFEKLNPNDSKNSITDHFVFKYLCDVVLISIRVRKIFIDGLDKQVALRLIYTATKMRRFRVKLGHLVTKEFYPVYATG